MRLVLDGSDLPAEECVGRPLAEILDTIGTLLSERGRVILEAQVNGRAPDAAQLAAPVEAAPEWRLEVVSGTQADLLLKSLRSSATALPDLAESLLQLSASFLRPSPAQLQGDLTECLALIRDFFEFLDQVGKNAPVEIGRLQMGDCTLTLHNRKMAGVLEEIVSAFAVKDYVRISDLLRYEAAPALDAYVTLMPRMIAAIEGPPAGAST